MRVAQAQPSSAPPCFYFGACGRRAELEKLGRSVCRRCAAHLRGDEYPLQLTEPRPTPAERTAKQQSQRHAAERQRRAAERRQANAAKKAERDHLKHEAREVERQRRAAEQKQLRAAKAADPAERERLRQQKLAGWLRYREGHRAILRERANLRQKRLRLARRGEALAKSLGPQSW